MALNAQSYRVYFSDKGENASMLANPYSFLSAKAIEHKARRNTTIDASDLPVSKDYVKQLEGLDLEVKLYSRWFNYALVEGEDVELKVTGLPFVKRVEKVKQVESYPAESITGTATTQLMYGESANQIEMVKGDYLHNLNNLGQGMTIAVIDGGFQGADVLPGFDSLWMNNRILGTHNFITNDANVYVDGTHGAHVLSIMGAQVDSMFLGTAIRANYWLLKSEDQSTEKAYEMDNWLLAAEFADSVGADIITSSLGYNEFVDGIGDIAYSELDGNTTLITNAADKAAQKGLLVVNSNGNEGNSNWKYLLAPADGDSVLAVGGVNEWEGYATFASQGPTADNRIKPDVSARAQGTAYVGTEVKRGNGTSFSCPIISGMAACLWQQYPSKTNMEIFEAIRMSASQYYSPNNEIGFGIPNFEMASWSLSQNEFSVNPRPFKVFPNPIQDEFSVQFDSNEINGEVELAIFDISGKKILQQKVELNGGSNIHIIAPEEAGTYILSIRIGDKIHLQKIVK